MDLQNEDSNAWLHVYFATTARSRCRCPIRGKCHDTSIQALRVVEYVLSFVPIEGLMPSYIASSGGSPSRIAFFGLLVLDGLYVRSLMSSQSVQFLAKTADQNPHPLISTIALRTLMDDRYFYGVRMAAASVLPSLAKDHLGWVGLYHLEKAFHELFCFNDSPMTRPNDFTDRASYYIQCAIPQAMARIKETSGVVPMRVRTFLFEKLRFNDNSNNEVPEPLSLLLRVYSLPTIPAYNIHPFLTTPSSPIPTTSPR